MRNYRNTLKTAVRASLFSAVIAACAYVSVPIAPPITLQLFAIAAAAFLFGGVFALISTALYISLGLIGLPVFAGFSGGAFHLLSPSGGFILGFILYCLIYSLAELMFGKNGKRRLIYSFVALAFLYALGVVWYMFVYQYGEKSALLPTLAVTVLPFIIPDAVKIFLAYIVAMRLKIYGDGNGKGKNRQN